LSLCQPYTRLTGKDMHLCAIKGWKTRIPDRNGKEKQWVSLMGLAVTAV
jgi:hypothetical protein